MLLIQVHNIGKAPVRELRDSEFVVEDNEGEAVNPARDSEREHDGYIKIPVRKACPYAVRQSQIQMTIGIYVVYSLYCYLFSIQIMATK